MSEIQSILEHQEQVIDNEISKKEEIEMIREMCEDDDSEMEVKVKNVAGGYYELIIVTGKIVGEIQDILDFSITSDSEVSSHPDGIIITSVLDYSPMGVEENPIKL